MPLLADLTAVLSDFSPASFAGLMSHLSQEWLEEAVSGALERPEAKPVRMRKLPTIRILWLVIGMALFRDRSIHEVVHHLGLTRLRGGVSAGAIPKARQRVGVEPVETLFKLSAKAWTEQEPEAVHWRGLSVLVADGSCLNVPDTKENEAAFGRPSNRESQGGYPQIRIVALLSARTHLLSAVKMGGLDEGELGLLRPLWDEVPDGSITLVDRGLHSWGAFHALASKGTDRHWLARAKSNLSCVVVRELGPGDDLVRVKVHSTVRKVFPEVPTALEFRRIRVRRPGYRDLAIITSAIDPERFPADEVAELYRERWEIEMSFDEFKTDLLNGATTVRSKTPQAVRQEMYGAAIAYNLVRLELARVATQLKVAPRRMSFRHGLMLIRNFMVGAWQTPVGALPRRMASLEEDLRLLVLPPRRARSYQRWMRYRRHRYPEHKLPAGGLAVIPGPPRLK
jgi:Insertion element 4 transposase N-terminal/Transposase DDE domain